VLNNPNDSWYEGYPGYIQPWTGTPGYAVSWESQSGYDRGCSNSIYLENSAGTTVEIDTSDPYSGSNGYTCTVSDPRYNCTISQSSSLGGDNIDVYWVLTGP
jgi:hypothetical protein